MRTTDDRGTGPTERSPDLRIAEVLNDCLGDWLDTRLGVLLGGLDDTLFANAVGAATREEQDEWFAAMQALRSLRGSFPGQLRARLRGPGGPRSVRASDADPEAQAWQTAFAAVAARRLDHSGRHRPAPDRSRLGYDPARHRSESGRAGRCLYPQ